MRDLHALVGDLSLILTALAAIWAIALLVLRRSPGMLFYANLIWVGVAVTAAAILGALTAVTTAPPGDLLHVVYGVLAVATLPIAGVVGANRPARGQAIVAVVASVVLLILVLRLLQTGV